MALNQENLKTFSEPLELKCPNCRAKKVQSWICRAAAGHWFAWCGACESVTADVKSKDKALKLFEESKFEVVGLVK